MLDPFEKMILTSAKMFFIFILIFLGSVFILEAGELVANTLIEIERIRSICI